MADAGENGVDGITFDAEQEVSAEMAIGFHVADDRLDSGAAAQLAADGGGDAALLAADENAGPIGIVAAIAVNSLPIVTPFSRPIATPLGAQVWAYPRSA